MQRIKRKTRIRRALFALAAFALAVSAGCSTPFIEKSRDAFASDIPEGFGAVRVSFTRGAARTAMPAADLAVLHLEYSFARDGEGTLAKEPENGVFILEPGAYTLEAKAFLDSGHNDLAAQGEASFVVSAGARPETVDLTLYPVTEEGAGSLEFSLEYPAGARVETLTLTRIAGEESFDLLDGAPKISGADPAVLSGLKTDIPAGYYMLRVLLKNSAGVSAGRVEAVRIYRDLAAAASYVFTDDDFQVFEVKNTNDSGSESLRQAIIDVLASAEVSPVIRVVELPPMSVIELETPLPEINKDLTIEGAGIVLTPAASWLVSDSSQLLRIRAPAEVTISRVYFQNGLAENYGGAIWNTGILTLESCVFSGNRVTGSLSYGGALYSENALTLLGCTFYENIAASSGGAVFFRDSGKTLTLTGNVFYRNDAAANYPVVYASGGDVNPSYNVVDADFGTRTATQCGWDPGPGDLRIYDLPVSPVSFKLLYGSGAAGRLPSPLPEGYPETDFYGDSITGGGASGGAAGAVQAKTDNQSGYYYLGLSVNNSQRGSAVVNSPSPDEDGLYPAGSISMTANVFDSRYVFGQWRINDVPDASTANPLEMTLSAHTWVEAVFYRPVTVSNFTDGPNSATTPGTLRYALDNAQGDDLITCDGVTAGTTAIALTRGLTIDRGYIRLIIEGSGVTLTRAASWTDSSNTSQLLYIKNPATEATIRRVYFKNGLAEDDGGAILNAGTLTLESCVFSGNRVTAPLSDGGAIYSRNTLTLRGCTFYENSAGSGGAVFFSASDKILTLTGNVFYRNYGSSSFPVVYMFNGKTDPSYNVVDADFGARQTTQCGWDPGPGDLRIYDLPVSPVSFRLLYESDAADRLPSPLPKGYPETDFYGDIITGGGASGAVQTPTTNQRGYYYLNLSVNNSLRGGVAIDSLPDADGLYSGTLPIAMKASPSGSGYVFGQWRINDVPAASSANPLEITLSAHTWVEAVFYRPVTVNNFTDGPDSSTTPGTLRYALTNAEGDDFITCVGVTAGTTAIALTRSLPINRGHIRLILDGSGVTLTRAASWTASSNTSQLLNISSNTADVIIRRTHFKNGLATDFGSAINNDSDFHRGALILESCIFSGNKTTGAAHGGAIYSEGDLIIRGCTFDGNVPVSDQGSARAVYLEARDKTMTLMGNLFYGFSGYYPVAQNSYATINASYNAVDVAFGTGSNQCGWAQGNGDIQISTDLPVSPASSRLFPGSGAAGVLPPTLPIGYPATDFYDDPITGGGSAGAVQTSVEHGSGYYYLGLLANDDMRGTVTTTSSPDADGLYSSVLPVTITANPTSPYEFGYWRVNGVLNTLSGVPMTITLSAHTWVETVFTRPVTVNDFTDGLNSAGTPGTLRYALTNAQDADLIDFTGVTPGTTAIELTRALPAITKTLIIEGSGITLTRDPSWTNVDNASQLLYITVTGPNPEVFIRRILFKDGRGRFYGGAIQSKGTLVLESCIFSGNQVTSAGASGGAVYSSGPLTIVLGCTFYDNTAGSGGGGALALESASAALLTMTGNLFYGNTATGSTSYPDIAWISGGTVSSSYNVVDKDFGTGAGHAGWIAGDGDATLGSLGISGAPFDTSTFAPVSALGNFLPSGIPGFPATDFYGIERTFPDAPGAVTETSVP